MLKIEELYQKTRNAAHYALYIVDDLRKCNLDAGIRLYRNFLANIQWILQGVLQNGQQMESLGITVEPAYVMNILQGMLNAQEQKDYVLLADLVEMQAYPFLTALLDMIRQGCQDTQQTQVLEYDYLEQNLKALEKQNPELAKQIRSYRPQADSVSNENHRYRSGETAYCIEPTSVGYPTCRIEKGTWSYYLHSNKDPYEEAGNWLSDIVDEEAKAYHILGCGLGYHGVTLYWKLKGNYPVHMYETDLNLLWLAMKYCFMEKPLQERLYLHYDPKLRQLSEAIGLTGHKLCIHYPSLRRIPDDEIRRRYEQFFIQDSSYRNAKLLLQGNFDANLSGLYKEPERIHTVDELKEHVQGKAVFIIAAGPSLDKNIALLKEHHEPGSIVVATGTVFRKLLGMGIRPDYVIVTDANERVVGQIYGVEQAGVPMLMLSTANHKFMTGYSAKHYLIFQEGYPRAEAAAKLLDLKLYQTGGSVSTTALDVAVRLGASKVIFLGLDLAYTDNLAHAQGTSNRVATDVEELVPVRAWGGGSVCADHKFIIYREWMERRLRSEDVSGTEVINATEGGSYIEGMRHIPLHEVLLSFPNHAPRE